MHARMQVFVPRKRPAPDVGDPELRWMDVGPVRLAEIAFVLIAGWCVCCFLRQCPYTRIHTKLLLSSSPACLRVCCTPLHAPPQAAGLLPPWVHAGYIQPMSILWGLTAARASDEVHWLCAGRCIW